MIEYIVRYSDGYREILTERVTEFGEEVIWVVPIDLNDDSKQGDEEVLFDEAQEAAVRDAGRPLVFHLTEDDEVVLMRTGDVFDQLVG